MQTIYYSMKRPVWKRSFIEYEHLKEYERSLIFEKLI